MVDKALRYRVEVSDLSSAITQLTNLRSSFAAVNAETFKSTDASKAAAASDAALVNQIDKVTGALKQNQAAAEFQTKTANDLRGASNEVAGAHEAASPKIQQFGSTIGMVGQAVSKLNPEMGGFIQVLAQAAGSVGSLSTALGPVGIALGVATTAFGLISTAIDVFDQRQHDVAANMQRDIIPTLDDMISKAQQAERTLNARARFAEGQGTETEQRLFTREAEDYLQSVRERVARAQNAGNDNAVAIAQTEEQRAAAVVAYRESLEERAYQTRVARERNDEELAAQHRAQRDLAYDLEAAEASGQVREQHARNAARIDSARGANDLGSLGRRVDVMAPEEENNRRRADLLLGQGASGDLGDLLSQSSEETAGFAAAERFQQQLSSTAAQAAHDMADAWRSGVDATIKALERLDAAMHQASGAGISMAEVVGQSAKATGSQIATYIGTQATSALEQHVGAWLDGKESIGKAAEEIAKSIVKSLVQESIVQTIVETARGLGSLASLDFVGATGHFTSAATWAAVGVVAGGVGLATGAFGGGGSAASAGSADSSKPSRFDTPSTQNDNAGPRQVTINVGTFPVSTSSQVADAVLEALDAHERVNGPTFARAS